MSELLDRAQPTHPQRKRQPTPAEPTRPGSSGNAAFAAALTELALTVHAGDCDPVTVITQGAVDLIPGTEFSALVIPAGPGQLEARATSGDPAPQIIGLQNEVGEGPCLEAVGHLGPVWVPTWPGRPAGRRSPPWPTAWGWAA